MKSLQTIIIIMVCYNALQYAIVYHMILPSGRVIQRHLPRNARFHRHRRSVCFLRRSVCLHRYRQDATIQGALQYKGCSIYGHTTQGQRTIHDRYKLPRFNTIVWRIIQDRASPLTHRRAVRVNLYCSAPCRHY